MGGSTRQERQLAVEEAVAALGLETVKHTLIGVPGRQTGLLTVGSMIS